MLSLFEGLVGALGLLLELLEAGLQDVALGGGGGDLGVELGSLLLDLLLLRFRLGLGLPGGVESLELLLEAPHEGGGVVVGLEAGLGEGGLDVSGEGLRLLLLRLGLPELSLEAVGLRLLLLARDAGVLEPLLGAAGRGFGLLQAGLDPYA